MSSRKREDDSREDSERDRKQSRGGKGVKGRGKVKDLPDHIGACFKVLIPDAFVDAVIGKGGRIRIEIEAETCATLLFSDRGQFFPGTSCRVLTIVAEKSHQMTKAVFQVVDRLFERGREIEDGKGSGKGYDESESLFGKVPGEYVFRFALPKPVAGALIGRGGEIIKSIRAETGGKLFIENETIEEHQMGRVVGNQDTMPLVLQRILETLDAEFQDFRGWAERTPLSFGSRDDGSKGERRDRGRDRGTGQGRNDWPDDEPHWEREENGCGGVDPSDAMAAACRLVSEFPRGSLDMAHAINCVLPKERVSALIGRNGGHIKHVRKLTGATCEFEDMRDSDTHSNLVVSGPLCAVYYAHMLIMRRYHEEEARKQYQDEEASAAEDAAAAAKIDSLQAQLAAIQEQLASAGGGGSRGGKGNSKGTRR